MHPTGQSARHPIGCSLPGLLKGRIEGRYWTQPRGRAGTLEPPRSRPGQPPFPPDAGAQEIEIHDERSIEARDQAFCRSAIFPCQKIDDRGKANLGPRPGKKSPARSAAPISTSSPRLLSATIRYTQCWSLCGSIELRRSALVSDTGTRKCQRVERSATAGLDTNLP